jgi:2-polyprenyl-3-methyl-5-hydroxy-6-metoxy-1,4-benzoquinol methylase
MSDQSPPAGGGPRRALNAAAKGALWAPSRFFDPRFSGLHEHVEVTYQDLLAHVADAIAHVDTGRAEARSHREAFEHQLSVLHDLIQSQIQATSEATTIIGRTVAEQRDAFDELIGQVRMGHDIDTVPEPQVEDLDRRTAHLLAYASSHRGFAAQRGLWFNPPTVLRYQEQDVTLANVTERIAEPAYVFRALAGVPRGGRVLDVGASESTVALSLASLGYEVTAIDPRPYPAAHPALRSVEGTVEGLEAEPFDAVVCLSTIEHVGIGAYGVEGAPDADLAAMRHIRELLRPGGVLALTTPFGTAEVQEHQRVYDRAGLGRLLDGFEVDDLTILRHTEPTVWQVADGDVGRDEGVALVTARRPD